MQSIYGISVATTAALVTLPYLLPTNFYTPVNGAQDDFQGATLKTNWQSTLVYAYPFLSNYIFTTSFIQTNGVLRCADNNTNYDGNFLCYVDQDYTGATDESVLMCMTITASNFKNFGVAGCAVTVPLDSEFAVARGGCDMVAVPPNYNPYGPSFPYFHTYSDFVADKTDNTNLAWQVGGSYWIRIQSATDIASPSDGAIFSGKVWLADGVTPEPADWDVQWKDLGFTRQGYSAVRAGFLTGAICSFDVKYFQVTSPGLPLITPTLPPSLNAQISAGITVGGGNAVVSWPNAAPGTYTVQTRSSLTSGSWGDVAALTVVSGAMNTVSVPYSGAQPAFFRLIAK